MSVRSYVRYTQTPNDIMYRVTSGVKFKTDKSTMTLPSLEIKLKKRAVVWLVIVCNCLG